MAKRCVWAGIMLGMLRRLASPMIPSALGADKPDGKKTEVKNTEGNKTAAEDRGEEGVPRPF